MFEKVSIKIHKQPEKKLALWKILLCYCSAVIWQRGDDRTSRWYRVERGWGARSKSFKKEKRVRASEQKSPLNKTSPLSYLNSIILTQEFLCVGVSDCSEHLERWCFPASWQQLCQVSPMLGCPSRLLLTPLALQSLPGHISRAAASLSFFILGGMDRNSECALDHPCVCCSSTVSK